MQNWNSNKQQLFPKNNNAKDLLFVVELMGKFARGLSFFRQNWIQSGWIVAPKFCRPLHKKHTKTQHTFQLHSFSQQHSGSIRLNTLSSSCFSALLGSVGYRIATQVKREAAEKEKKVSIQPCWESNDFGCAPLLLLSLHQFMADWYNWMLYPDLLSLFF